MSRRQATSGIPASEQALLDLWDYIDQIRLKSTETHAAIAARAALEAARKAARPDDPIVAMIKNPQWDLR